MKVRIEITKGPDQGRQFVLEPNERRLIGRGDHVQIKMLDELVSREHCEIQFDGQQLTVSDLGSTNCTFVQQNLRQPISPKQRYSIANGQCFFVGPESCFTVHYENADATYPQTPPTAPPPSTGNSNFSASIVSPGRAGFGPASTPFGGDSSIFNLTGHVSPSPGIDPVQKPVMPPSPAAPVSQPVQRPVNQSHSSDAAGYHSNSIVPPGQQGIDGPVFRDQIKDEEFVNEEHLKSTPSVEESDVSEPVQDDIDHVSPFASIAPPGGLPPASDPPVSPPITSAPPSARPKPDTTPTSPPAGQPTPPGAHAHSPFDSIASPGAVYYDPVPAPAPLQPTPPVVTESPTKIPGSEEAIEETSARQQPNGLFFHTGQEVGFLNEALENLSQQWQPVYCVDFSKLEIESESAPENDSPFDDSSKPPTDSQPAPDADSSSGSSSFELEEENASPFADSVTPPLTDEEPQAPAEPTTPAAPEIKGVPLFDFLPEGLKHNGPVLLTQDQFEHSLDSIWHHDGVIVFWGEDPSAIIEHLQQLLNLNIQSGKPSKAIFGFCWPSVLHTTLEAQPAAAVDRVFDSSIACVLLEDPQHRFAWNLVAREDLAPKLPWLPKD